MTLCWAAALLIRTHTVKKSSWFSRSQLRCHLLNSPWTGIIKLFPARGSLVNDIPAGDRKMANLFYSADDLAAMPGNRKSGLSRLFNAGWNIHEYTVYAKCQKSLYFMLYVRHIFSHHHHEPKKGIVATFDLYCVQFVLLWLEYIHSLEKKCNEFWTSGFFHESVSLKPQHRFTCEYLREFSTKFEMILMLFSGAWGRWVMKKPDAKNLVTLSL